jgi:hypothetical protein
MKRFLLPLAVTAIVGILLPSGVRPAYACSCIDSSPAGKVRQADVIVLGVVDDVTFLGLVDRNTGRLLPGTEPGTLRHLTGQVQMRIEANLKGDGHTKLIVEHKDVDVRRDADGTVTVQLFGGSNCAVFDGIPAGRRYLLFLYVNESGTYSTSTCSGSRWLRPITGYGEDYESHLAGYDKALGLSPGTILSIANAPDAALPPLPATGSDHGVPWLPIIVGSALGATTLGASLLLRRRLTRR